MAVQTSQSWFLYRSLGCTSFLEDIVTGEFVIIAVSGPSVCSVAMNVRACAPVALTLPCLGSVPLCFCVRFGGCHTHRALGSCTGQRPVSYKAISAALCHDYCFMNVELTTCVHSRSVGGELGLPMHYGAWTPSSGMRPRILKTSCDGHG